MIELKKFLSLVLTGALLSATLLGCSGNSGNSQNGSNPPKDNGEINVYNWGEYIDPEVLELFEQETGIKVNYTNYAHNEERYAKIRGGSSTYDVIIPSDYMIGRMIEEDMLEKLDFSNIPNYADIGEEYKNTDYDPTNEYSVPYTWGTVGIIYNTKLVNETPDSWDILWDEAYQGQILMFDNPRDAIGLSLKRLGYSYNTTDKAEIQAAVDELKKQKPLVQAYVMDQIFDKMINEEAAVSVYYAGDAITMIDENPDLAFAFPKEGTNLFIDAMCVPKGAPNKAGAEAFINFMCRADIAAMNCEAIGYSTPSEKTFELLDEELQNSEIAYPSEEILNKAQTFSNLPDEILKLYDELWFEVYSS